MGDLIRNRNLLPLGALIEFRNATMEDHTWRTGGGASKLGSAFDAARTGKVAFNFWPDADTERNIVVDDTGQIWKDDGVGGGWAIIHTLATTSGFHQFLVPGAAETSGSNRKLFYFDGRNDPRYLDGDGAAMTALASPAATGRRATSTASRASGCRTRATCGPVATGTRRAGSTARV